MCYNESAKRIFGPVAQLGERSVRIREVESSSLFRSTIHEKSELISDWKCVRIFCFYQRHYILMITPRGLNMSSGFFCCAPGGCILYCCWAAFRYGNLFQCYKNEEAEMGNTDGADVHADDIRLLQVHRKQPRPIRFFLYCAKK